MASTYLRNTPCMVITFIRKPANHVNTSVKGWSNNVDNWTTNEQMIIVDRLTNNHMTSGDIVINLLTDTIISNRINADENKIFDNYYSIYADNIKNAIINWTGKDPKNLEKYLSSKKGNIDGQ